MRLKNKALDWVHIANWRRDPTEATRENKEFEGVINRLAISSEVIFTKQAGVRIVFQPPVTLAKKEKGDIALFTVTDKMSCLSFSLPAGPMAFGGTCPASNLKKEKFVQLAKGAGRSSFSGQIKLGDRLPVNTKSLKKKNISGKYICDLCYAGKSRYAWDSNLLGQAIRKRWVMKTMGEDRFVEQMVGGLRSVLDYDPFLRGKLSATSYFRIHDSGDFFHPSYFLGWVQIARNFPEVKFWCPTRQWVFPPWRKLFKENFTPNLVLRPSALVFGTDAPMFPPTSGMAAGSTSSPKAMANHWQCPAYETVSGSYASACCRTCWDRPQDPVNYKAH